MVAGQQPHRATPDLSPAPLNAELDRWLRQLQRSLSLEADSGFQDLQGQRSRFSVFLTQQCRSPSAQLPAKQCALLRRQLRGGRPALLRQEDAEARALTLQILKTGICFQAEAALQLTQPAIQLRIQRSWTQIWGCTVGLLSCDHSCCACRTASRCCQC